MLKPKSLPRACLLLLGTLIGAGCAGPVGAVTPSQSVPATVALTSVGLPAFTATPAASPSPTVVLSDDASFIDRPTGAIFRIMTYNVGWDSIFPDDDPLNHELRQASRGEAFERIMRAVKPDIVCLQEINQRRAAADLAAHLSGLMNEGEAWQVVHVRDTALASRFPLIEQGYQLRTRTMLPNLDQAAALVDLPRSVAGPTDMYIVCSHFKAGGTLGDILLRVRQADAIMAHLRDFGSANGGIPQGLPLVLLGDYNIYDTDPARQLRTLLRGDISDQGRYGADWQPDWDGTPLLDAHPSHNGQGADDYTWREDASPFNPRALDRIIYSDSVLKLENAFVLNTELLTDRVLAELGLQRQDVLLDPELGLHDHLPVVADFSLVPLD